VPEPLLVLLTVLVFEPVWPVELLCVSLLAGLRA
jgi:hypothetical protein